MDLMLGEVLPERREPGDLGGSSPVCIGGLTESESDDGFFCCVKNGRGPLLERGIVGEIGVASWRLSQEHMPAFLVLYI